MIQALYSGASALTNHQRNMDVIGNNIANINTDGFKRTRADYMDAIYQAMRSPTDNRPIMNLQRGHGLNISQANHIFFQGSLTETGDPLDMALEGEGFFTFESPDGEVVYSRSASLQISNEEDGLYLVGQQGYYLLDTDGNRVQFQGTPEQVTITSDGVMSFGPVDQPLGTAALAIADFPNKPGLTSRTGTYFAQSVNSGAPTVSEAVVVQSYRESSNVDYAEEVTRMIRTQRAYQLASRVITTADQMAGLCNSIRS